MVTVDQVGDRVFSLAKVLQEANGYVQFHYYGTTDPDVRTARFSPVFLENKTGLMLLGDLRPEEKANPWVGWVPQEEGYVILQGPKLTKAGRLTADTLRRLRGFTHFVIPSDD